MRKLLNNGIFKSLLSAVLFGVIYTLLTFVVEGIVETEEVLISVVSYFLVMCLLYFIAPKLRKITGHDKGNN